MSSSPEHQQIWVNNTPENFARIERSVDPTTKAVTITIHHLSGEITVHPAGHDTIFQQQRPDLFHGDTRSEGDVKKTTTARLNPIVNLDKVATDIAPTSRINLSALPPSDFDSTVITGNDLHARGFHGFLVDSEKQRVGQTIRKQIIFNLSIVDRIITSPRRDLLLILWKNTEGQIRETHFPFSSVRRWAILTQQEVRQKKPHFS